MSKKFGGTEAYISGASQDGPSYVTPVERGIYPAHNKTSAYPLYADKIEECHTIQEGEMMLNYNPSSKSKDKACVTSSFNGFDALKRPQNAVMAAFQITMEAHKLFTFAGFAKYTIQPDATGAAMQTGVIVTKNNSGETLQLAQPVCWMCEDPQKIGNNKARPVIVTQTDMRKLIERWEKIPGVAPIDPLLRERMLTPFGRVTKVGPNGKDVKILIVF